MSDSKKIVSILNELTSICKDGERGFLAAADGLKNSELRALCVQYSKERARFALELQNEVRQLEGDPADLGTVAGAIHRGWLNIKKVVTGGQDDAIIAECEAGEDAAKEAYAKALNAYMPAGTVGVVQKQYTHIKEGHDRFSAMKNAAVQ